MATKKAYQAEASNTSTEFVFEGETYTIPPAKLWPLSVLRAQEDGKMITAIELLLGKDQMAKFESKPRTMGDLEDLLEVAFASVEVDPKG